MEIKTWKAGPPSALTAPGLNHRTGNSNAEFLIRNEKSNPEHFWKPLHSALAERKGAFLGGTGNLSHVSHLAEHLYIASDQ